MPQNNKWVKERGRARRRPVRAPFSQLPFPIPLPPFHSFACLQLGEEDMLSENHAATLASLSSLKKSQNISFTALNSAYSFTQTDVTLP